MLRDTRFDKQYFDRWIAFIQERNVDHDRRQIETLLRDEGRAQCGDDLVRNSIQIGIMRYGRGDVVLEMADSVNQAIEMLRLRHLTMTGIELSTDVRRMYERLDLGKLYESLTLLAFMYSLRYPIEQLQEVLALVGHAGEDALLDRVAIAIGDVSGIVAKRSKFPKVYDALVDVIAAPSAERPAKLASYLEGWYKRMRPVYWHDSHIGGDGAYFGYWCFEAALIAMVFEVDDTLIRTHPHYPSDLCKHHRAAQSR